MDNAVRLIVATLAMFAVCTAALAQDQDAVEAGGETYDQNCATCHGDKLTDPGGAPDLRELHAADRERFETTVMEGRGQMPSWRGVLDKAQVDALWSYIRAHAFDR